MISHINGAPFAAGGSSGHFAHDASRSVTTAGFGRGQRGEGPANATRPETAQRIDPPRQTVAAETVPGRLTRLLPDAPALDPDAPAGPPPAFKQSVLERRRAELVAPPDLPREVPETDAPNPEAEPASDAAEARPEEPRTDLRGRYRDLEAVGSDPAPVESGDTGGGRRYDVVR